MRRERVIAWTLVTLQLVLLAGLVVMPGPRRWTASGWLAAVTVVMIGAAGVFAVAAAGNLGRGMTASPLPSAAAQLRTTGAYAYVRHPIYTALLVAGAGAVLLGGRLSRVWVWLGLLALLSIKARFEEMHLARRFPGYRAYAASTPRLIPRPTRRRRS